MFPSQEAGDFFNNEVILLKYQLDLEDPDGIMEKYGIKAYPTFILVDGNGEEYSRFIGGAQTTEQFLTKTQNALKPENSWAYRNNKLKSDPSYTLEHIKYLNGVYMQDQAKELLSSFFKTRSVAENFSDESIQLYNSLITDTKSPIVDYMLNNPKEVAAVMGDEAFTLFLFSKADNQILSLFTRLNFEKPESVGDFENEVKTINANRFFSSPFTQFFANNLGEIKAKKDEVILNNLKKSLALFTSSERRMAINFPNYLARIFKIEVDQEVMNQRTISICEAAIEVEKDPRTLEGFKNTLERLKNPQ